MSVNLARTSPLLHLHAKRFCKLFSNQLPVCFIYFQYYFTSFLSREEAFKQIVTQWSKHSPQARFWLGTHVPEVRRKTVVQRIGMVQNSIHSILQRVTSENRH